jgi:protein-tyrosine-phosphatase/predicted ATP-grasp superfamily ATP-dependent carboligase
MATGRVLVFGDDDRSLLGTVRSLGRKKLEVHVANCPADCHTLASRYVARAHTLPPFVDDGAAFIAAARDLLSSTKFDLVVPCNDASILPLAVARAQLAPLARVYLQDDETLAIVNDKARSAALARAHGVPVAREVLLRRGEDPMRALDELRLPLVCKPLSTFSLRRLDHKRHVQKAYDLSTYRELTARMLIEGDVVVQENFIGTGVGVEVLAHEGKILAAFQHRRVHEPMEGGGSSYRTSVPLDPALVGATQKLIAALAYTGVGMFEYKQNDAGEFVFIEINGRFWGSLPLAIAAGADFPAWLYELLVEGRREFPRDYRVGLYCRNTLKDMRWMIFNLRADRTDPTLATRPLGDVAGELLNVVGGRERNDTLVLDDPLPGLLDVAEIASNVARKVERGVQRAVKQLPPVRRLAAGRARRKLSDARVVTFVCKGNICRSPFAASLAAARWPDVTILSAGHYPQPDRSPPEGAVAVAREFGVELAAHRSRVLDRDLVTASDAVIVFDDENVERVLGAFPDAADKIVRLGVFDGALEIEDPFGGDADAFRACYASIARAIAAVR